MAYTGTAQQKIGLDIASARIAKGTGSSADVRNVNYAKQNLGYAYVPTATSGVNQPISATNLGQSNTQTLSQILGANVPTSINSDIAGLLALYGKTTDSEKQYDSLNQTLIEKTKQLGGQASDLQAALGAQGVTQAFDQVKQLNLRGAQLQGQLSQFDAESQQLSSNLDNQAIPTGLIQGQQAILAKQRDLSRSSLAAELASTTALAQAYQGNAQLGQQLAQQSVDLKYAPIQNEINVLTQQLGIAKDKMNSDDQKRVTIIQQLISQKQSEIDQQKANESKVQDLAITAAGNGAPLSAINSLKGMTDPIQAAKAVGQWLHTPATGPSTKDAYTSGFINQQVEQDVRSDAGKLLSDVFSGTITQQQAYEQLRSMYSNKEVSDKALAGLLPGFNLQVYNSDKYLASNPRQSYIAPTKPKQSTIQKLSNAGASVRKVAEKVGSPYSVISGAISKFLFKK